MSVFQRIISRFAPGYMRGPWSSTLLEAVGAHMDEQAQRAFDGQCASIPYAGGAATHDGIPLQCGADVLPWHARDRGITLYPTEPEASRRWRLSRFRQLKRHKGSALGVLMNVRPYFLSPGPVPHLAIVHASGDGLSCTWHEMSAAGVYTVTRVTPSNHDLDGDASKWSRWCLFVDALGADSSPVPALIPEPAWDAWAWDDGARLDGLTTAVASDLVDMARSWGAPHAQMAGLAINRLPGSLGPSTVLAYNSHGWSTTADGRWGAPVTGQGDATWPPYIDWLYKV